MPIVMIFVKQLVLFMETLVDTMGPLGVADKITNYPQATWAI